MTPAEIIALRHSTGHSVADFAAALHLSPKSGPRVVRRWEAGHQKPGPASVYLMRLLQERHTHEANHG